MAQPAHRRDVPNGRVFSGPERNPCVAILMATALKHELPALAGRQALMNVILLLLALIVASAAHAEEFGGWRFDTPAGAQRAETGGHITFTKIKDSTFCQIALFSAHAPTADDGAFEWKYVVEANFKVRSAGPPTRQTTRQGLQLLTTSASVADKAGNAYAATLSVVLARGASGSVLITASNIAALSTCPADDFLGSLVLVAVPRTQATAAQPPAAGPAADDSIDGAWATGAGNAAANQGTGTTLRRQYTFKADGTYTYVSELFNGVNEWIHVRESGTYTRAGDKLTIAPATSTSSARDWNKVTSTQQRALETVTYTVRKHYFSGIKEWGLVLTPPQATERDGAFAVNAQFKDSYLFSGSYKPAWKWP
jgi:hypothetical protein